MLPAAKIFVVTVLLGGGTVGTYALAGGKFGAGGNNAGDAETAQTSTPEVTKPSEDATLASNPSSSTLVDGSLEEGVSDASIREGASRPESEDQGKVKVGDAANTDGETIVGAPGKNETGDVSPRQPEGDQVPESLPAAPTGGVQQTLEPKRDDQSLSNTKQGQEDAQTKVTKESSGDQGNAEQKVNQEQVTEAGVKSQNSATDGSNTDTSLKDQGVSGGEETRAASGETVQQGQEPAAVGS